MSFLSVQDFISAGVQLDRKKWKHNFLAADGLVTPVIFGVDFLLQMNGLILDFASTPVTVRSTTSYIRVPHSPPWPPVFHSEYKGEAWVSALIHQPADVTDDCAFPDFGESKHLEFPQCSHPSLSSVSEANWDLFRMTPGTTSVAHHYIPTQGPQVHLPPCRTPAQYGAEV